MAVRVGDPARLPDLVEHLTGLGCSAVVIDDATLAVELTDVQRRDAAELELDLYLRVWEARTETTAARLGDG